MDAGGSAADAEIDGAAPAVSQQALQLQMAFQRLEVRGGRWEGAYSGMQGMTVADFVQYGARMVPFPVLDGGLYLPLENPTR